MGVRKEFFLKVLYQAVEDLNLSKKRIEISLNLIGEKKMRELNNKFRHKDSPTDVLSFPLDEKNLNKYDIIPLGDIFICPQYAKREASVRNIKLEVELARLAIHGFLHLLGYDHEKSKKEKDKMLTLQEKILNKVK